MLRKTVSGAAPTATVASPAPCNCRLSALGQAGEGASPEQLKRGGRYGPFTPSCSGRSRPARAVTLIRFTARFRPIDIESRPGRGSLRDPCAGPGQAGKEASRHHCAVTLVGLGPRADPPAGDIRYRAARRLLRDRCAAPVRMFARRSGSLRDLSAERHESRPVRRSLRDPCTGPGSCSFFVLDSESLVW